MGISVVQNLRQQGYEKLHLSMRDGTLTDSSPSKNNGTFGVNSRIIKSENGMSLFLDNASYITVADSPVFFANQSPYSTLHWIRRSRTIIADESLLNQIGGADSSWRVLIHNNLFSLQHYDGVGFAIVSGALSLSTMQWYCVTTVYTGGVVGTNAYLYVNGLLDGSGNMSRAARDSAMNPAIGMSANLAGWDTYFGFVDTAVYYQNYALSAWEVATLMRETAPRD